MTAYYAHRDFDLPGYREATEFYRRRNDEFDGPDPLRRGLAYMGALYDCWEEYGGGTPQVAAALYYYMQWLKALNPKEALKACLALVEAERGFVSVASDDMQGTMENLALAICAKRQDSRLDIALAAEVATRFAIALSRYFNRSAGKAELNFGHCLFELRQYRLAAYWLEVGLVRIQNQPKRVANALRTRAYALYRAGDIDASEKAYRQALITLRDSPDPTVARELAVALYQYSIVLEELEKMDLAAAAIIECDTLEVEKALFDDSPKERETTERRRADLEPFRQSSTSIYDQALMGEKLFDDTKDSLGEYHKALALKDFDEALRLARDRGPLWHLNARVARLEVDFATNRLESLMDKFFDLLGDASYSAMKQPSPQDLSLSSEPVTLDSGRTPIDDHSLLCTAINVRALLLATLPGRPNMELADATCRLTELCIPPGASEIPLFVQAGSEIFPLPPRQSSELETQLARIRHRGMTYFKDQPMQRVRCTAEIWNNSTALSELKVRDRTIFIELQDFPSDLLAAELAYLEDFPNLVGLILFGNSLCDADLKDIDFEDFRELMVLELSENSLQTLPPSLAKHPSLEWLSLRWNSELVLDLDELSLPNLRYLDLRECNILEHEFQALKTLLPECSILWSNVALRSR